MTERKRKKERITHALERRRTRQIRQGVTQWIAVATDLSGMRAKIAAQQHAQVRESGNFKFSVKIQCELEFNFFLYSNPMINWNKMLNQIGNYIVIKIYDCCILNSICMF